LNAKVINPTHDAPEEFGQKKNCSFRNSFSVRNKFNPDLEFHCFGEKPKQMKFLIVMP